MPPAESETPSGAGYFEANAAPPGSALYYACLFAEPAHRPLVLALHTLENELIKSLTSIQDPGVARLRLEWWCDEIRRAGNAEARHPLGQTLQPFILAGTPAAEQLITAIQSLEAELAARDAEDFDTVLRQYREHFGPFWRLSAVCCGIRDETALDQATTLGALHHMQRALQGLTHSLNQGLCRPLPHDELEQAGLAAETLAGAKAGPDFLRRQAATLRQQLEAARQHFPPAEAPRLLHGLILTRLDTVLLGEIERDADGDLLHKAYSLTPLRRLWHAWRTRQWALRRQRRA